MAPATAAEPRWVEGFLEALAAYGFSAQESVTVYRAFATFLLGHLLLETATLAGEGEPVGEDDTGDSRAGQLSEYPILTSLSAQLSQDAFEEEFDNALHDLIKRVASSTADAVLPSLFGYGPSGVVTLWTIETAGAMTEMTDNRRVDVSDDVDRTDGRDESLNERMDRNWNEILQELRVTQTGTQIFTGFLLTIAFQSRFSELTTFQVRVYLVLVIAAVLTTALGMAPVNLHRGLFRKGAKMIIVQTAHVIMRITLVGVAVMLIRTVLLIFDLVLDRSSALIAAGVTLLIVIVLAALPAILRSNRSTHSPEDQTTS